MNYKTGRVGLDIGIYAMVCTGYYAVALFKFPVNAAIAASPVGMFTKKTDASRNKNIHNYASVLDQSEECDANTVSITETSSFMLDTVRSASSLSGFSVT